MAFQAHARDEGFIAADDDHDEQIRDHHDVDEAEDDEHDRHLVQLGRPIATFDRDRVQQIPRDYLAQIIQVRLEEILGFVANEIKRSGYSGLLGAGVILAGGVAEQAGIKELAESLLDLPVRVGQPHGVDRLDERLAGPAFATAVGLLVWAANNGTGGAPPPGRGLAARGAGAMGGLGGRLGGAARGILRAFLPD
jgi:cell division protein FtsA